MEQVIDLKIPPLSVLYFKGKKRAPRRVKATQAAEEKPVKKTDKTKKAAARKTTRKTPVRKAQLDSKSE